jgi:hypothetical protein
VKGLGDLEWMRCKNGGTRVGAWIGCAGGSIGALFAKAAVESLAKML